MTSKTRYHCKLSRFIVVNRRHGGFSLSNLGIQRYAELKGLKLYSRTMTTYGLQQHIEFYTNPKWSKESRFNDRQINRQDEALIAVVHELGAAANGPLAALEVVEIPADVDWYIDDYGGAEIVVEVHREW